MPFKKWIFPTGENLEGRRKRIEVWTDGERVRAAEYLLPPKWAPLGASSLILRTGSLSAEAVKKLLSEGHSEADIADYIAGSPSGGYQTAIAFRVGDGPIDTRWGGQILPAGAEPLAFGVLKDECITIYPMTITPWPEEAEQAVSKALEPLTFRGQRGAATTIPAS